MQVVCPRLSFSSLKSLGTRLRGGIHKLNSSGVSKGEGCIKDGQAVWQWQPYIFMGEMCMWMEGLSVSVMQKRAR